MTTTDHTSNVSFWRFFQWPRWERYGASAVTTLFSPPLGLLMFIVLLFHEATQLGQKALDALRQEWRNHVNAFRKARHEWAGWWRRVWWKITDRFTPTPAPAPVETSADRVQRAARQYQQDRQIIERLPVNDAEKAALERTSKKSMLFRVKGEIEGNAGR